jgi:hypothetical protein
MPAGITDRRASQITVASAAILYPLFCSGPQRRRAQKVKEVKNSGYIPCGLFQTKGETCAKFGSEM